MVIISYTGLDLFLVGELNGKIHSLVSETLNISDEEVVFSSYDSFIYYKGHEQTSINLIIKVEMEEKYRSYQEKLANLLLESSKEYSVHAFVYFSYYKEGNSYSRINEDYPLYLTSSNEREEDEYDVENEYDDETLYTGNIFNEYEVENDDSPIGFDSLIKK